MQYGVCRIAIYFAFKLCTSWYKYCWNELLVVSANTKLYMYSIQFLLNFLHIFFYFLLEDRLICLPWKGTHRLPFVCVTWPWRQCRVLCIVIVHLMGHGLFFHSQSGWLTCRLKYFTSPLPSISLSLSFFTYTLTLTHILAYTHLLTHFWSVCAVCCVFVAYIYHATKQIVSIHPFKILILININMKYRAAWYHSELIKSWHFCIRAWHIFNLIWLWRRHIMNNDNRQNLLVFCLPRVWGMGGGVWWWRAVRRFG